MSYDVYFEIDTGGKELHAVDSFNHTSNCYHMFFFAMDRSDGQCIKALNGMSAKVAEPVLEEACKVMESNPSRFRDMNPASGWGDSLSAYVFLTRLRDACRNHPLTLLRVCA